MLDHKYDDLLRAAEAGDVPSLFEAMGGLWQVAQHAGPDELSHVVVRAPGLFQVIPSIGLRAQLAVLFGGLTELGADPAPLAEQLSDGLSEALELVIEYAAVWKDAAPDEPLPPMEGTAFEMSLPVLAPLVGEEHAQRLAQGWAEIGQWKMAAVTMLQKSGAVRRRLAGSERLIAAITTATTVDQDLDWPTRLLAVLDDEPLLVLHPATGLGYELTIGGIGDNFQLHTLLADALGDFLGVERPDPTWVASAVDGPLEPAVWPIRGQFNLVDGYGSAIWNEGVPADIPFFEGRRVVVLKPPPYPRTWNIGRLYPMMRPLLRIDRPLSPDEAASWLGKVTSPV
ncbi:hypothetical protein ACQPYK_12845 [Streptosporangium sp. CA-135522]|uniref:hypothetical protein n=1 Tax=Streptosporangium sp. CA-135522 TaxID=3240072 RepID=UPI003D8DBA9A